MISNSVNDKDREVIMFSKLIIFDRTEKRHKACNIEVECSTK